MICLDIQTIIKNYESYVINWTRPLALRVGRRQMSVRLVRAPSHKLQATSFKLQATSVKPQAASVKFKATSYKLLDSRTTEKFHGA